MNEPREKVIYNFVDFNKDLCYTERTEFNFENVEDASRYIKSVWEAEEQYYNDAAQSYNYDKARLISEDELYTAIVCGEEDDTYELAYIDKVLLFPSEEH